MLREIKRLLVRRDAVRTETAELVRIFGSEAAEIAMLRSQGIGLTDEQRRFWLSVADFARYWHQHLAALDIGTRYVEAGMYLRR